MGLRQIRIDKGMTQVDLAEMCNVSTSLICDIEAGRCRPSITTALKIAEALGIKDVDEFAKAYGEDDITGRDGTD